MTSFLEGPLAGALAKGFAGKLLAGTLTKVTGTSRDAKGDPVTTTATYAVQGFVDGYSAMVRAAAGIPVTDSRITLIAGLCGAAPSIGDKMLIGGKTWQLRNVSIDPANATYDCQAWVP